MMKFVLGAAALGLMLGSCNKSERLTADALYNLERGDWRVVQLTDDEEDHTADFAAYTFRFADGTITATHTDGSTHTGTYREERDDNEKELEFNLTEVGIWDEMSEDWHVVEASDERIVLKDDHHDDDDDLFDDDDDDEHEDDEEVLIFEKKK